MTGLVVWSLVAWLSPSSGAPVILGKQHSEYLVRAADRSFQFPSYRNNGYIQTVREEDGVDLVEVRVRNTQLASKMSGRHVSGLPAEMRALETQLNQTADGRLADQVSLIIGWLRDEIQADQSSEDGQQPEEILRRGSADCVGLANLTLFVLRKMGVEARYVTGLAYRRGDAAVMRLKGRVLHRWIEINYDDVGWVFCDPAGKVNFVEATYVVLGVEGLHPIADQLEKAFDARVELLRFSNGFRAVGAISELDNRIRVRPNRLFVNPKP